MNGSILQLCFGILTDSTKLLVLHARYCKIIPFKTVHCITVVSNRHLLSEGSRKFDVCCAPLNTEYKNSSTRLTVSQSQCIDFTSINYSSLIRVSNEKTMEKKTRIVELKRRQTMDIYRSRGGSVILNKRMYEIWAK